MFKKLLVLTAMLCFLLFTSLVAADEENVSYFTGYWNIICKHSNVEDFERASKALHSDNIKENYFAVIEEDGVCVKVYESQIDPSE